MSARNDREIFGGNLKIFRGNHIRDYGRNPAKSKGLEEKPRKTLWQNLCRNLVKIEEELLDSHQKKFLKDLWMHFWKGSPEGIH